MTTEATTSTAPTKADLEKKLAEAKLELDAVNTAFQTEMRKEDSDEDTIETLVMKRRVARNAVSAAESELSRFAANESWSALANTLRPVNRALESTASAGLPTPQPKGLSGSVNIADDGAVSVDVRMTFDEADLTDLKAAVRRIVEQSRDAFKAQSVKGFSFKLDKTESGGWAPSIAPLGAARTSAPAKSTGTVGSGKGSNVYRDPAGKVYTAREVIAALRSTYTGKQESIDNALGTGNGVRNIAVALIGKNAGWTIAKE